MNYSRKILQTEKFYIIIPVQSTAGSMHVRLCLLKTVYMITNNIQSRYYSCNIVSNEKFLNDTTTKIHRRCYSRKIVFTENGINDYTSTIRSRKYTRNIVPTEIGVYDTTSTINSRFFHVRICHQKTVFMISPVLSTAGIIHVSL